jgi:uncharacterized protein YndB with AHSA1/START domain
MIIRERSVIDRPPATVWPYIIRAESFAKWNTKISSMEATGEFHVGQPFTTHYRWNNKPIQCVTVATEVQPGRLLELRHSGLTGQGIRPDMEIVERVTLRGEGRGSTVTKVVTLKNHGIPWLFIPLVWFVANFGARVDADPLKLLVERGDGG